MSDIFWWGWIVFQRLQGEPKPWCSVTVLAARPNTLLKIFILALTLICHPSVCPIIALLLAMICFSSGENIQQLVANTVCMLFGAGQIAYSGKIRAFVLKTAACICWKWLWEGWDWPSVVKTQTISSKVLKCYIKQRAGYQFSINHLVHCIFKYTAALNSFSTLYHDEGAFPSMLVSTVWIKNGFPDSRVRVMGEPVGAELPWKQ